MMLFTTGMGWGEYDTNYWFARGYDSASSRPYSDTGMLLVT